MKLKIEKCILSRILYVLIAIMCIFLLILVTNNISNVDDNDDRDPVTIHVIESRVEPVEISVEDVEPELELTNQIKITEESSREPIDPSMFPID